LNPHDCLTAIDSKGCVYFWAIGNTRIKNIFMGIKEYITKGITLKRENFFASCYNFFPKKRYLVFGDEFGNVKVWCCKPLMDLLDLLE